MSLTDNPEDVVLIMGAMGIAIFIFFLGPMAWLLFAIVFFVALAMAFTGDGSGTRDSDGRPAFCANCGAELDVELGDGADGEEFGVDYCSSCGAPVPDSSGDEEPAEPTERINCPGCGSLVAADEAECGHCGEAMRTESVVSSR